MIDFSGWIFIAVLLTAIATLVDRWYLAPAREKGRVHSAILRGTVGWMRSFFPVLLVVFVLRAFVVEPYRIPSGSMLPGLKVGDFILVIKYQYGLRMPIWNHELADLQDPERGDVAVFKYPRDPSLNYVKRIIGLPGDQISYRAGRLYVNGILVRREPVQEQALSGNHTLAPGTQTLRSVLDQRSFLILKHHRSHDADFEFQVPQGEYFVMGDNRDRSSDSRVWGSVPEHLLVGKAKWVWMSWDSDSGSVRWDRLGTNIQ